MTPSNLDAIAQAVAEETELDWLAVEASADPAESEAIRQLRLVASIAQSARQLTARWGPFELRNQIGHGTFGTVYRAWDPKVDREVALKLLNAAAGPVSDVGTIQEARLLATAEHPNIVPVYGADVHEGRVGIWMKFIHGRTLKDILCEQGPFGAWEAALIGRDLCDALGVVHKCGLIHRDLKAQNVMREIGGRVVLMDFGAGQPLAAAKDEPLRGSPAYLAPELLAGQPATPRSDLYSLAVLLYHLVSGDFPVVATSWDDLRTKHARNERRSLKAIRPDLPKWFVDAVDRGLAADPEQRPATAAELSRLLEPARQRPRLVGVATFAIGIAVLLTAVYGTWAWSRRTVPASARLSSMAILPFENLTGASDLDFLSHGLPRRIGTRLSALSGLKVIVPSNTIKTAGSGGPGGDLGVESSLICQLTGTVQQVRLRCDLGDTRSHQVIQTDEHRVDDIAALESELAHRVAFVLKGSLSGDEDARLAGSAVPPAALSLYLRGRHEWSLRTEDSLNRSIKYYQEALRVAPAFAPAHSGLADAYTLLGAYGFMSRPRANTLAFEAAARAVALDAMLPESHFSMGYAYKNRFEWSAAEASFRRGLELNPDASTGHHWFSIYLSQRGRFADALAEARLAITLDPSSLAARTNFATLLLMARRYRDSIAQWEACIALGSDQVNTYRAMSKAYVYLHDRPHALQFADAARERGQSGAADEELKADLGYVYAETGRRAEAIALADELVLRYRSAGEGIAGSIAAVYTGLGDREQAFHWLAIAEREQDPELGYLLVDPKWDPLRGDGRFHRALVNVHLVSD